MRYIIIIIIIIMGSQIF